MPFYGELSEEHIERAQTVYQECVELVDHHLKNYDPARDGLPPQYAKFFGGPLASAPTVRYTIDGVMPDSGLVPYCTALESASVIAFQSFERRDDTPFRKIELLDPFRALGGVTLLLIGLEDADMRHPQLPGAYVHGELAGPTHGRPLYSRSLSDNLSDMVHNVKRHDERGMLSPINFMDVQAMYSLQNDLERL